MSQETKQIFSIRKFKTGTHSALLAKYGLALVSSAILMGAAGTVSADEVTTPTNPTVTLTANPATNLETAQAAPSEANQATAQSSGTQTGTLTNEVTSDSLNTAVSAAQDAGVTVSKEASVTHDSLSTAQADLASQETSLKEVTAKAEANTKAINDAKATNAQIDAENQAEKERVEALNKAGEEETNQRNIRNEQAVNARNAQLQAEYNKLLEEYNAAIKTNEAIEAANATAKKEADEQNAKNLKEYQEKLAQYYDAIASIANNAATDTSFSSDDLKKFLLSSSGQNPLYVIGEKGAEITADLSHLETLSDSERQDYLNRVKQVFSDDSANAKTEVRIAEENIADSHLYKLKVGDTITYNGAVSGEGVITKATVTNITGTENGFITANVDTNAIGFNSHDTGGTMSIRLDFIKDRRPAQGSYIVGFGDVDWLQGVSFSKQPTAILYGKSIHEISGHYDAISDVGIEGSDLAEGQVWALFDNVDSVEFTYHDNSEMVKKQPLTQRGSAWYFAVGGVTLGVDNIFRYPTPPIPDEVTPKQLVPVPETPIQPELESFTPETYTPVTPTVKPHVAVPEKESFSVAVHPVFVTQTPTNVKDVVDTDTVSTNGHLVPKGSIQTWTLTNEGLKAGRDRVTSFVMTDPIPSGFVIDRDATAKANADAWTVAYKEDGKLELVATDSTLAALNANKNQDVTVPVAYLVGSPQNDGGTYQNTFTTTVTTPSGEYKVVSNTPVIYTPGNDTEKPRETPNGDNPTPDDNLIQPKKDVVDDNGNSINGQSVLPNTVLHYVAKQDFDQYKGMTASKAAIAKGFVYVDDYLDQALDGQSLVVKSITAANGDDVSSLLEMHHVLSPESLDAKLAELVKASGISPVGEFYLWVAKDPQAFYQAYVQKGLDITYNLSFKIKDSFTSGDITNQTYQIDFANGYYGNIVVNHLPQLEVHKDVLDKEGKSLDQGTVKIGDEVTYKLEGWVVPTGRSYDLFEYKFVDQLQHSHDLYLRDKVVAKVDITLTNGTVLKKGTDLAQYTETVYNKETGRYELAFKEDFLKQVSRESEFGADDFVVVKRLKAGDVYNTTDLYVNGYKVKSETVVTHTAETPKPKTPKPKTPKPSTPVKEAGVPSLPQTGEESQASLLATMLGLMTLGLAGLGFKKKKTSK